MSRSTAKLHVVRGGDASFYQFHPVFGFWGIPGRERNIRFEYLSGDELIYAAHNRWGNRDHEDIRQGGVLCLGGSHSWGVGVQQDARYSEVVGRLTGLPAHNLGHCSLGLDQICLAVQTLAGDYAPRAVVIEQYPWALHRVSNTYVNGYVKPKYFLTPEGSLGLRRVPKLTRIGLWRAVVGAYHAYAKGLVEHMNGIDLTRSYDPAADPMFLRWKAWFYSPMYALAEAIVISLRDFCQARGIHLLFALAAVAQQYGPPSASPLVDYTLPRDRFAALLDKCEVPYVDASAALLERHSAEAPSAFHDGHLNPKGHGIFGKCIATALEKEGMLA